MRSAHSTTTNVEIEGRILSLLRLHRKLTFSSIADAVPEYRWLDLLHALNRLRDQRQIELSPLQWDYEITLANWKPAVKRNPVPVMGAIESHEKNGPESEG